MYAVTEPIPVRERIDLDVGELGAVLEPGGALSRLSDSYEPRPSQVAMLRMVAEGFNDGSVGIAEAGTGVGKSFAYLIPAFRWAERNGERVVISTGTINLQHQLLEKDIPTVKRLLGSNVKAVLVKGRGNYLCRKRLEEALEEPTLFEDDMDQLRAILEWSKKNRGREQIRSLLSPERAGLVFGLFGSGFLHGTPLRCAGGLLRHPGPPGGRLGGSARREPPPALRGSFDAALRSGLRPDGGSASVPSDHFRRGA